MPTLPTVSEEPSMPPAGTAHPPLSCSGAAVGCFAIMVCLPYVLDAAESDSPWAITVTIGVLIVNTLGVGVARLRRWRQRH